MSSLPPQHVQVLIIGGGPAGSYAASALAREGLEVAVLESAQFPRYHIGESLIPSVRHYSKFIGAQEKLMQHGFAPKPGAAIKFAQFKTEGYTDFTAASPDNSSWNVVRSEFDHILLEHASSCGASVHQLTRVDELQFSPTEPDRPIAASWTSSLPAGESQTKTQGTTSFDYIIDASGRRGILSTTYRKDRRMAESLKNIAIWGYWTGTRHYGEGTSRAGAPWFEGLDDRSGWAWHIPVNDGTVSVGVVLAQSAYTAMSRSLRDDGSASSLEDKYRSILKLAPGLMKMLESGTLVPKKGAGEQKETRVRMASDFSYSAEGYAGPGYRIIGDAAAFIDPFFSSGCHLAFTSALSAAASICASVRGDCTEAEAVAWHSKRVATSYTRFQVVVLSAYKEIRGENIDASGDVDVESFQRGLAIIRPLIHGASDVGTRLTAAEVDHALNFCSKAFGLTTPEQREAVAEHSGLPASVLDVNAPAVNTDEAMRLVQSRSEEQGSEEHQATNGHVLPGEKETRQVVEHANARRVIHQEWSLHNLEVEGVDGRAIRLERGNLGLQVLSAEA
ncbi:FAD/NAD(P)-binding domain-containing protein [Coniophora puteana RWD-64-598 SS2]|uniref:FAD/NAD(P)-binding domain-containing protein n=1 Tax=Coniophora puteana (strain RWD-64-598) TaxID=741705 RepID=A0A5M3MNT6_CONPW|nr:FAD/NAD(P)-binding domain-containing protein [Coniophora puteana RWD-64-598 SS2]EIW80822.1 FAD/NAD(P)-binding domain-containing protein [Coniophora puteana RWD-64-598 SS2]